MISFIKGILEEKREDSLVVENQGIGYEILVPATVLVKCRPQETM